MEETTIATIAVGIALAGLLLATTRSIRREIADVRKSLGGEIADARTGLGGETAELRRGQEQLRERMAHLEGLLEGLREAIVRNRAA